MRPKPLTPQELNDLIVERIVRYGNACDLNDVDISAIHDFSQLFKRVAFRGDISKWDVGHVTNMHEMFARSDFNGDISQWNVANVRDMSHMFDGSQFNSDISQWDVSGVKTMRGMFTYALFNGSLASWDVSGVEDFSKMFYGTPYEPDLSAWRPRNAKTMEAMLWDSAYKGTFTLWRPPEDCNTDYLMNPTKLEDSNGPSFYHFKLMYLERAPFNREWLAFVNQHRPLIEGTGMTAMQASLWLHTQWFEGPTAYSELPIPQAVLDELVQR